MQTTQAIMSARLSLENALRVQYVGAGTVPKLARTLDGARTMIEAVVGDTLQFGVNIDAINTTFTLVREPARPEPEPAPDDDGPVAVAKRAMAARAGCLEGGRLSVARPGLYVIRVTLTGGWSRDVSIAAFSPKALDRLIFPPDYLPERRTRLRAIVDDKRCTPETVIAALEATGSGLFGIEPALLGGAPINVANYASE